VSYPPPPPPQYPYGGGQPGWPPPGPVPDEGRATTALVLGILGMTICSVLAPIAWVMGRNSMRAIDASGGRLGGRGKAQAGFILGIVGTALLALGVVLLVLVLGFSVSSTSEGLRY
jgi:uncharacterized protein DUF4190